MSAKKKVGHPPLRRPLSEKDQRVLDLLDVIACMSLMPADQRTRREQAVVEEAAKLQKYLYTIGVHRDTVRRPAAFFDRDGTLIKSPPGGTYFSDPSQVVVNEYAVAWVKACNRQGYPVLVVTNQSGIGKGLVTAEQVEAANRRVQLEFAEREAEITDVLYCPHVQGECICRKPGLGLLEQYERMYPIDRLKSVMFGDSWQDFQFAKNAKIHYVQLQQYYISRPHIAEAKRFLKCDIPVK